MSTGSYRPVSDYLVPELAKIERTGPVKEAEEGDLAEWEEDHADHWAALALFGALAAVEGGLFTWFAAGVYWPAVGVGFVLIGVLILLVGALVVPELGGGFGWAILAGATLAIVLGAYMGLEPLPAAATVGSLWTGGHPASSALAWTIRLLEAGGLLAFVLGIVQAVRWTIRLRRE